ncbi:unnamed protein product [Withania somnifera]
MGKVSPKDGKSKTPKQKRRSKSTKSKYLRPGALAQLRDTKISAAKCSTDLWKKRVVVRNADDANEEVVLPNDVNDESPCISVNILCHLRHDQLKAVFHVSQKIRTAVILARQFHFNYTTPDRMPQDKLGTMPPLPPHYCPIASKGHGKGAWVHSPRTPLAPMLGPSPPFRFKCVGMEPIAGGVLFLESAFPKSRLVPSVIRKPLCNSLGSNRVLFYEDELCQAVSQNKLS